MSLKRARLALPLLGVVAALIVAGCGGSTHKSSSSAGSAPATTSGSAPAAQSSGIPQAGGGDHDADNNGGPSDGDGNI